MKQTFQAWLKNQAMAQAANNKLEANSVYHGVLLDPYFPPLDPRENEKMFMAKFQNYRLPKEVHDKLVLSFWEAVEEYDPPLIQKTR